uniref:Uncharacterized protein n=1 Tax=Anguilla anguilla TaxID=7936 RepID=A0A0E9S6P8_ANGAN
MLTFCEACLDFTIFRRVPASSF